MKLLNTAIAMLLLTGLLQAEERSITILTQPSGANITIDGSHIGYSGQQIRLNKTLFTDPKGQPVERTLTIELNGHASATLPLKWGNLNQPSIGDAEGKPIPLPANNFLYTLLDYWPYVLTLGLLALSGLGYQIHRSRQQAKADQIEVERAQERQALAEQERLKAEEEAKVAEAQRLQAEEKEREAQVAQAESDRKLKILADEKRAAQEKLDKLNALAGSEGKTHFREMGCYYLLKCIGQGGFGEIWLGCPMEQIDNDSLVAIKLITKDRQSNEEYKKRFKREAKVTKDLRHPNLVPVLDYGFEDEPYLVLEFIEGKSLERVLEEAPERKLPQHEALSIFYGICLGVEALHSQNIIHRDLKPPNIMLSSKSGQPVIIDLGNARVQEDEKHSQSTFVTAVHQEVSGLETREVVTTHGYGSPELYRGATDSETCASPNIDQFALGIILIELLTGQVPKQALRENVAGRTIDFTPDDEKSLPPAFIEAARRMSASEPLERYASVQEARLKLQAILANC